LKACKISGSIPLALLHLNRLTVAVNKDKLFSEFPLFRKKNHNAMEAAMKIKSGDLPGIGKRYSFETSEKENLVVIFHQSGQRELYHFAGSDEDEPDFTLKLNDEEARQLGTLLLGVDYQPVAEERVELFLKSVRIEWLQVAPGSELANKKIIDSRIRSKTGATIIGIQRGQDMIGSPDIEEMILPGDTLMVIGSREQTKNVGSLCQSSIQALHEDDAKNDPDG
jgi:TrkA domain protein